MYNPSRGGVRGGADQFTWESVKSDKHRENYLGHSLKAPVGRWQKGKDLSWYSKERKDTEEQNLLNKSELAAIKQAEEEAMLIALGQKVTRKETQPLSKEEIKEALKRNTVDRDNLNIERVGGVGTGRRNLLAGISTRPSNEGVTFETVRNKAEPEKHEDVSLSIKKSKKKEKSKKHKKEKKCKKSHRSSDSEDYKLSNRHRRDSVSPEKRKSHKKLKLKRRSSSSSLEGGHQKRCKHKKHKLDRNEKHEVHQSKRRRHDTSDSE